MHRLTEASSIGRSSRSTILCSSQSATTVVLSSSWLVFADVGRRSRRWCCPCDGVMALMIGARLGAYEIIEAIGAGRLEVFETRPVSLRHASLLSSRGFQASAL